MRLERARHFTLMACLGAMPIVALAPGGATPALGAPAVPAVPADYDSLMREGIALRRAGDDSSALKRFQQAYELNKTAKAMAQIGLAEQALGRWASADGHLRQAIASADDPWIRKNRGSIDDALAVIAGHLGRLEIGGTPAGAEVRVDGEIVGHLPLAHPITVTAGGVAIELRAAGYVPIVRAATVAARTLTRETFTLQSLAPAQEPVAGARAAPPKAERPVDGTPAWSAPGVASTAPESTGLPSAGEPTASEGVAKAGERATDSGGTWGTGRRVAVVAVGLSVAAVAFGAFEHWSWQKKVSSFGSNQACGTKFQNLGAPGCKTLYDDGRRARTLAFVGYGVTGALLATALILYLTDSGTPSESSGKLACAPTLPTSGMVCAMAF